MGRALPEPTGRSNCTWPRQTGINKEWPEVKLERRMTFMRS